MSDIEYVFLETCESVTLVEREAAFIEIAKNELDPAISIVQDDCVNYSTEENSYDVVFMSGVSIYLDDFALRRCMANMKSI